MVLSSSFGHRYWPISDAEIRKLSASDKLLIVSYRVHERLGKKVSDILLDPDAIKAYSDPAPDQPVGKCARCEKYHPDWFFRSCWGCSQGVFL